MNAISNRQSAWEARAANVLLAENVRAGETPLLALDLPKYQRAGIHLYLKDESVQPTGSLKHRLASSLFSYAICNSKLHPERPVIEASSGSTAVSEAYFAKLLGLRFFAVMPRTTSAEKVSLISHYGGQCKFVDSPDELYNVARQIASDTGGLYMDQFTNAERVTDWRSNNIAESIIDQLKSEQHPTPAWIVCGAGTGGTSATIGRFLKYRGLTTKVCVADPEGSAFKPYWESRNRDVKAPGSKIEGIGRHCVEPSFVPSVIDESMEVTDHQSLAGMSVLSSILARKVGPSSGTNFYALIDLAERMLKAGKSGSLVSILCDSGERYLRTYHNDEWVQSRFGSGHTLSREALYELVSTTTSY